VGAISGALGSEGHQLRPLPRPSVRGFGAVLFGRPRVRSSILRLSSRCAERWHAPRHSLLDMCVSRSQYAIQSFRPQPPPPAVLWADSLGLALSAVGEGSLSVLTVPPVSGVVVNCGDNGAIGGAEVIGVPITEAGGVVVVACGAVGAVSFGADFDD
jgi:hypothetical protein